MIRPTVALAAVLSPIALSVLGYSRASHTRYNSEEHRLIVDRGVARVKIPPGVKFPSPGVSRSAINATAYADAIRSAKRLAVGFETNNPSDYDKTKGSVQDNCYWTNFHQSEYNKAIYVPSPDQVPDTVLAVLGWTSGTSAGGFTMGQLAAFYGDYRRTTWCDASGKCFLTDADVGDIKFGKGNVLQKEKYCPPSMLAGRYLEAIASGLVPPFGTLANTISNTADDAEYNEAALWGDEMLRIGNINDWHFSSGAIAWYVGLHRLALVYADSARLDPKYWTRALHYEANALHSLTDLFAFGHVVTNRDETSYDIMKGMASNAGYQWMENVIRMGGGTRSGSGAVALSASLPTIKDVSGVRNDFVKSYRTTLAQSVKADGERRYHDEFNKSGAQVRNLNGDDFYILGDAKLSQTFAAGNSAAVIINAVRTSVQSLIDAHVELKSAEGRPVAAIGAAGSPYFAALKYVPVFVGHDANGYFPGYWARYANAVVGITGANKTLSNWDRCQVPYLSGKDGPAWPSKPASACATF